MRTLIEKIRAWFDDGGYIVEIVVERDGRDVQAIEFKKLKVKTLKEIWHLTKSKVCAILYKTKKKR